MAPPDNVASCIRESSADESMESLVNAYLKASPIRPEVLFRHFLPTGYRQTMLNSVATELQAAAVLSKVHLGMIITYYDDLADQPLHRNPRLLSHLYQLNIGSDRRPPAGLSKHEHEGFELARYLFSGLAASLERFPFFRMLCPVLRFDIEQFYACNRHSELMTAMPAIRNLTESRVLGPHNMGIVAAGTIDLMASPGFSMNELGRCREVFHLGQRLGRISNLVYTFDREMDEGDATNEILISNESRSGTIEEYRAEVLREFLATSDLIRTHELHTFETSRYADGFRELHRLHASLAGRI